MLPLDIVVAFIFIAAVIEGTRRTLGLPLTIVACLAFFYTFFGRHFPGFLYHRGFSFNRVAQVLAIGFDGIFGTCVGVSTSFVYLFIMFGSFFKVFGAGQFLINLACSLYGAKRGGPAKIAVVASGLFGMISGSAIANVATTGTFTIPLMKKTGYSGQFAAAVEAVASTGGQLMPPIMGAAAFIMAETLQMSYWSIAAAAFLPGLLYFYAVFIAVDMEAVINNIGGIPKEKLPSFKKTLQSGWYFLIPIFVLIGLLGILLYSPQRSAAFALGSLLVLSAFTKAGRSKFKELGTATINTSLGMLEVIGSVSAAGVIIGSLMLTGMPLRFSSILISLSGGQLFPLLLITMVASLILGIGLTTTAVYIILAVLVAPAIVQLGVDPIGAHLFVFYFGCISAITPPVAVAAYIGAGIAGSHPMKTGVTASRLGVTAFLLPYAWVYGPALLFDGAWYEVLLAFVSATIGITALTAGVRGAYIRRLGGLERILLLAASILLVVPGMTTDLIGLALLAWPAFNVYRTEHRLL